MLRTLDGGLYELPSTLPRTSASVVTWWMEMKRETRNKKEEAEKYQWPSLYHVTQDEDDKTLFHGLILPRTIQFPANQTYWFLPHGGCVNESCLSFLCRIPIGDRRVHFPTPLYRQAHPRIVERVLTILQNEVHLHRVTGDMISEMARNPDDEVIDAVDAFVENHPTFRPHRNLGRYQNLSLRLAEHMVASSPPFQHDHPMKSALFQTTHPELIRQIWESTVEGAEQTGQTRFFYYLSANSSPTAVELLRRDLDRFHLYKAKVAYECTDDDVLRRCLDRLADETFLSSVDSFDILRNPSDVVADWILAQSVFIQRNIRKWTARNPNDRVVDLFLAAFPSISDRLFFECMKNPNPRMVGRILQRLESISDTTFCSFLMRMGNQDLGWVPARTLYAIWKRARNTPSAVGYTVQVCQQSAITALMADPSVHIQFHE